MEITGQILKENREKAGLTLNEVSLATKINVKILEAMENGQKKALPAMTFLRGFVIIYAKYLKLDEESILQTFYEEMGTSKPHKLRKANEVNGEDNKDVIFNPRSLASKFFAVTGILVLILLILFVRQIVNKYEKEAQIPPPEDIKEIVQQHVEIDAESNEDEKPNIIEKPVDIVETPAPAPTPVTAPAPPATIKPIEKVEKTVETNSPPAKPVLSEKILEAEKLVKKPVEKPTEKATEKVEKTIEANLKTKIPANPQEIIIEALDNTKLAITIDNKNKFDISLKASEIHVIKANSSIVLNLTDGGAVSLIHNGKRKGVPGDLGRSMKLDFP
ncbi:MAG: helix-turn-helix domain-containing protein [Bdellovibrionaceae bacterium]|nr:helix-turn-helix domain-containing protein [Pseudobdellovibrionaceae bacterium]